MTRDRRGATTSTRCAAGAACSSPAASRPIRGPRPCRRRPGRRRSAWAARRSSIPERRAARAAGRRALRRRRARRAGGGAAGAGHGRAPGAGARRARRAPGEASRGRRPGRPDRAPRPGGAGQLRRARGVRGHRCGAPRDRVRDSVGRAVRPDGTGPVGPAGGSPAALVLWAGRSGDPHGEEPDPGLLEIDVPDVLAALARLPDDGRASAPRWRSCRADSRCRVPAGTSTVVTSHRQLRDPPRAARSGRPKQAGSRTPRVARMQDATRIRRPRVE
jgi:hypothetical protein